MTPDEPTRLVPALEFSYHRALAAPLWAFASVMMVELVIVHLLVSGLWSQAAAAILSSFSIAALIWVLLLIRSLKRRPVLVDENEVLMRVGLLRSLDVPLAGIARVRTDWPREALKLRSVLNLALINYPNVMIELDPPLPARRRSIKAVAHCLDEPAGFVAVVERAIRKLGAGE